MQNHTIFSRTFTGKTVWITGASSGIGEALAYALAEAGATLILSARREDELERVRSACKCSHEHKVVVLDMLDNDAVLVTAEKVLAESGAPDYLFNNAGITQRALIKDADAAMYRKVMEINYFSVVTLTQALLPAMLERGSGHIITTSSIAGLVGIPYRSAYCSSKHAVIGFMDSLRAEVHDQGLRVTTLCPGFVQTNIIETARREGTARADVEDTVIANGMPVDIAVQQALEAIIKEEEQVVIAEGKEKFAPLIKRLFPKLAYKIVRSAKTT